MNKVWLGIAMIAGLIVSAIGGCSRAKAVDRSAQGKARAAVIFTMATLESTDSLWLEEDRDENPDDASPGHTRTSILEAMDSLADGPWKENAMLVDVTIPESIYQIELEDRPTKGCATSGCPISRIDKGRGSEPPPRSLWNAVDVARFVGGQERIHDNGPRDVAAQTLATCHVQHLQPIGAWTYRERLLARRPLRARFAESRPMRTLMWRLFRR